MQDDSNDRFSRFIPKDLPAAFIVGAFGAGGATTLLMIWLFQAWPS